MVANLTHSDDPDLCVICHAHGADKRTLTMGCLYDLTEVVPEFHMEPWVHAEGKRLMRLNIDDRPHPAPVQFHTARICKGCRGALIGHLAEWRKERLAVRDVSKDHDGNPLESDPERNIPVRVNGAVVMMDRAGYEAYLANKAVVFP